MGLEEGDDEDEGKGGRGEGEGEVERGALIGEAAQESEGEEEEGGCQQGDVAGQGEVGAGHGGNFECHDDELYPGGGVGSRIFGL